MKHLSASEMLWVWEQGLNRPLLQRMLILLAAASPDLSASQIAALSIGQRDRRLLQLREQLFGPALVNTAVCPQCSERTEWESQVADLLLQDAEKRSESGAYELEAGSYQLSFRLPDSTDLALISSEQNTDAAVGQLLARCISQASHKGKPCAPEQLPDHVTEALNQRIEALDPQADISFELNCPQCGHHWDVQFDIATFLWTEINAWAERTLQTVHTLARTYGWTERAILELSPVRRQLYLGMVG